MPKETSLDGAIALLDYKLPAVRTIIQSKYRGDYAAINSIARLCARRIERRLPEGEFSYCFVPQSVAQRHNPRLNASEVIAVALAGGSFIFRSLQKIKDTPHQATLNKAERLKNLVGAFALPRKVVAPEIVIICDDVITTGTTVSSVARVLRKHGSSCIWAVAIAHD